MDKSFESIASEFKIPLSIQSKKDDYEKSQILMIRHAFTDYNLENQKYNREKAKKNPTGNQWQDPDWKALCTNVLFADVDINQIGKEQARNSQKQINDIDFHTVFVSPLTRAVHTAAILFDTHPNKANIKFIILPHITDVKNSLSSTMNHSVQSVV